MKLLIVTSLREDQQKVSGIFEQARIQVFSVTETMGVKDNQELDLMDSWFANGVARYDSIFLFSFTSDERAQDALSLIRAYNADTPSEYPLRAFVLPVEKSSY